MYIIDFIKEMINHYNKFPDSRYTRDNIPVIYHSNGWAIYVDSRDGWGSPDASVPVTLKEHMFMNRLRITVKDRIGNRLGRVEFNEKFGICDEDDCRVYELEGMFRYMDENTF